MTLESLEHLRNIGAFVSPIVACVGLYLIHMNMIKQKRLEHKIRALEEAFLTFGIFARNVQIHKLKIESGEYKRIKGHDLYGDNDLITLDKANRLMQLYAPKDLAKRTQQALEAFKKHEQIDIEKVILHPLRRHIRQMLREEPLSTAEKHFKVGWYGSIQDDCGIKKIKGKRKSASS